MNSSVTNFVSLPLSTEPFETMKTKLARTVVKLVIASTTAQSSAMSQPTSFVVSVVMLAIWQEIVQTGNVVRTGVTMLQVVLQ